MKKYLQVIIVVGLFVISQIKPEKNRKNQKKLIAAQTTTTEISIEDAQELRKILGSDEEPLTRFTKEMKRDVADSEEIVGGMGFNYTNASSVARYARYAADIEKIPHEQAKSIITDLLIERGLRDAGLEDAWFTGGVKGEISSKVRETVEDAFGNGDDGNTN